MTFRSINLVRIWLMNQQIQSLVQQPQNHRLRAFKYSQCFVIGVPSFCGCETPSCQFPASLCSSSSRKPPHCSWTEKLLSLCPLSIDGLFDHSLKICCMPTICQTPCISGLSGKSPSTVNVTRTVCTILT